MQKSETILGGLDPEISARLVSRREVIRKGAATGAAAAAGLAMASAPVALAALSREAFGQTPSGVVAVLNFALMLEIFENEFYKAVLGLSDAAAQNSAFATVRSLIPTTSGTYRALVQIQKHEQAHVDFLKANGATNVLDLSATSFDFTGGRGSGDGPFARATTEAAFLLLVAQAAEDTGVRAYKGQAPNLMSNTVALEAALRIHSVEARHAAKIRRLRRAATGNTVLRYSGTVRGGGAGAAGAGNISSPPSGAVAALGLIYGGTGDGEATTTQAGVDLTTLPNLPSGIDLASAASEAFDEPLTKDQVRTIVQGFFIPTIP